MAVGRPRFLEMAVDMTLSLRPYTRHPVALATDPELRDACQSRYPDVFDEVTLIPERFLDGRARKYGTAEASPYEETMFIDADCIVLGDLDYLWSALEYSDLAMVGAQLTPQDDHDHHGFSTRWLIRRFGLERYMKTNSGLFCFRRSAALEIMEDCLTCFRDEARPRLRWQIALGRWLGDEIAFGIVGGRRNLGMLPVPAPMYWPADFDALDLDAPSKPLLHFLWPPAPDTLERLIGGIEARRRSAGLPTDASHWRVEARELNRMARRRRFLERLKRG